LHVLNDSLVFVLKKLPIEEAFFYLFDFVESSCHKLHGQVI
jgi:hypothetical protein